MTDTPRPSDLVKDTFPDAAARTPEISSSRGVALRR